MSSIYVGDIWPNYPKSSLGMSRTTGFLWVAWLKSSRNFSVIPAMFVGTTLILRHVFFCMKMSGWSVSWWCDAYQIIRFMMFYEVLCVCYVCFSHTGLRIHSKSSFNKKNRLLRLQFSLLQTTDAFFNHHHLTNITPIKYHARYIYLFPLHLHPKNDDIISISSVNLFINHVL